MTNPDAMNAPLFSTILPIKLTNGNAGRGFDHWGSTKARRMIERKLRAHGLTREPFAFPVRVAVTRILGKGERLWDASSVLRGNWKEIEDSLVAMGWFFDDGPRWITHVSGCQKDDMRDTGPATMVKIFKP